MKRAFLYGIIILVMLFALGASFADSQLGSSTLSIPDDAKIIEELAFFGDTSITEINLPEGLQRIEKRAFAYTALSSVLLPASLQYFSPDAFEGCSDEFIIWVYPESEALQLCESYHIPYRVKHEFRCKVGISMPTDALVRWHREGELIRELLSDAGYEVDLRYASNSVLTESTNISEMIDNGCQVLIIASIGNSYLNTVLSVAESKGIPVIAYDRLLYETNAVSYYVTFNNYMVGAIQGNYVKNALNLNGAAGPFVVEFTAGDPGDIYARSYYSGVFDALKPFIDGGKLIVKSGQVSFDNVATPTWRSEVAQYRAEAILSSFYADGTDIDAWICSNDSTALGVIYALDANYSGKWPIITGQDCDIAAVTNIIAGKQSMSVFKDTRRLVAQVAKMVDQIMNGEEVEVNDTESINNGVKVVPSFLCNPVFADRNNYREVLIGSVYYTEDDFN